MKTDQVREHFRVQVPEYAGLIRRLIPFYDKQQDLLLALIPFERTASLRVIDLGCGPGLLAANVLAEFPNAHLTALDLTSEMIEACRDRLLGNDRVTYQIGDFRNDEFGSGYDVILASLSLHHMTLTERPTFAEHAFQSLAPGGFLISAEVIIDESLDVREQQYELWRRYMVAQGEDGNSWYKKHVAKDHPVEISSWISTLKRAGFASVGCFFRYLNFAIVGASRPLSPRGLMTEE
jgi:tRNA (cmo5U34)-methyltransferase